MKEKINIICLILITLGILISAGVYIQKQTIYINAYNHCIEKGYPDFLC
ncbi:unnamed protein product, partial [marine sediment metagenome]